MSGQLLALWVLAILLAHLLAVLVLSWWRADNTQVHPLSVRTIETRVASTYRAVLRSNDVATLLEDISLPDSQFGLGAAALTAAPVDGTQEAVLAEHLRRTLNLAESLPIHVALVKVPAKHEPVDAGPLPAWLSRSLRGDHAWALDVEVALAGGNWLRSRHVPNMMPAHWGRVLSFSLLVGTIPTTLIAIFFGRRIMRPLRLLTEASRRVSRGEPMQLPRPAGPEGVHEITRAFNEMQESLLRFVGGRTQMIAAIGHDLRTPLTSLRIRAELIDDDGLRKAMVKTLEEMGVIVEGTLQFAHDDARHEPTQEVLLHGLLNEVMQGKRFQGHDVTSVCDVGEEVLYRCRPVHLKRALNNLIDNASRYGRVDIRSSLIESVQQYRIEIDDEGPGIPSDQLEQVFEPFVRLDEARSESGGVGLGLAIARSCIRAHGGEVSLVNRLEGGLRAVVSLPV